MAMHHVDHKLALECGVSFVKDYYLKLAQSPERLAVMYSEASVFCHHIQDKPPNPLVGVQQITERLQKFQYENTERKFSLVSLECHPSLYGSVMVLVKGTILMRKSSQDFTHAFLLAKDGTGAGYYIHNDCMEVGQIMTESAPATEPPTQTNHTKAQQPTSTPAPADDPRPTPPQSPPRPAVPQKTVAPAVASPQREEAVQEEQEAGEEAADVDVAEEMGDADAGGDEADAEHDDEGDQTEEAQQSNAPMSWARIAGSKGSGAEKKPQQKAAAKPAATTGGAEPPKTHQQPQAQATKEVKEPPKDVPAESKDQAKPNITSWAGLVAHSGKATAPQGAQRVAGGRISGRDYEQKTQREEDVPKRPAKEEQPERRTASPPPKAPQDKKEEKQSGSNNKYQYAALYVSKLPDSFKESDIDTVFGAFGTIVGKTFRPGQYCFIDYDDADAVRKALEKHDGPGVFFKGTRITVAERKSPEQRAKEREQKGGNSTGASKGKGVAAE